MLDKSWLLETLEHAGGESPEDVYNRVCNELKSPSSSSNISEVELWEIRRAIFDSANDAKRIYVDISILIKCDFKTGIQRVTRSILKHLILSPPHGYSVEPEFSTIGRPGFILLAIM